MNYLPPDELSQMEFEEQQARERLAELRNREALSDGEAPTADKEALHRLEAEWRHLRDRLSRARRAHKH